MVNTKLTKSKAAKGFSLSEWLGRRSFDVRERVAFYTAICNFMEASDQLVNAIKRYRKQKLAQGVSDKDGLIKIYNTIVKKIDSGATFNMAIRGYIPKAESLIIESYERSGQLVSGLRQVSYDVSQAGSLRGKWKNMMFKPVLLFSGSYIITIIYGSQAFPILNSLFPHENWSLTKQIIYFLVTFVSNYWASIILLNAFIVFLIIYSLPRYTGPGRAFLDKFPPWAFYKLDVASSFTSSLLCQMKAGVQLKVALENISRNCEDKYSANKLKIILKHIKKGATLSSALNSAGGDFPDKRLAILMSMHEGKDSFVTQLPIQYFNWYKEQENDLNVMSERIDTLSMAINALYACVLFLVMQSLSSDVSNMMSVN